MKTLTFLSTVLALLLPSVMAPRPAGAEAKGSPPKAKKESPFACDRLALTPDERKRHFQELGPSLRALGKEVKELDDGYEIEFPSDTKTFQLLAEWVNGERRCCPFLDIAIRVERDRGPLWLRLSGRPGTKEFLAAEAGAWLKR